MKYLKLIQQTVFVLLILLDMDLSGQIAISCNGDIIPVNRILQDDINLNGINFEAYAESDKVRNAWWRQWNSSCFFNQIQWHL